MHSNAIFMLRKLAAIVPNGTMQFAFIVNENNSNQSIHLIINQIQFIMKKKVFSLMMTLLLAFMGVAKADVVTIGDGTGTYYYAPYNSLWGYSFVEQVYTASEIGTAGTINAISFNMQSTSASTNQVDVFMKNVTRSNFSGNTDWETVTANDMVFSGTVTFNSGWTTITLDTPFAYNGTSNLMIGMHEYTSGYSTRYFYCTDVAGGLISGHSDGENPNPYNMGSFGGTTYVQNYRANIQIDITPGEGGDYEAGLHTLAYYDGAGAIEDQEELIDVLHIVRPNGAWMEPYHFNLYNDGAASVEVLVIDFLHNNGYFTMESEVPFTVANNGRPGVDLYINTNDEWNDTEAINSLLAVNTNERSTHLYEIIAEPYQPYCPDVVEKAYNLGNLTQGIEWREYMSSLWDGPQGQFELHPNYDMPDFEENIPDGYDAVMKFTVDRAMSLNARVVEGYENGKVALYAADFGGQPGPMADNYYDERPMDGGSSTPAGPGFEAVIGNEQSTSYFSYFPFHVFFNYSLGECLLTAAELQGSGVTTAPMTSLSWDAYSVTSNQQQHNIKIWMANVSDAALTTTSHNTSGMTLVFSGDYPLPTVGWNEFVFNQNNFAWDGHSNILIVCQRNNGAYNGRVEWRSHNPGFVAVSYDYTDGSAYNCESQTYSMMTSSTSRPNIKLRSNGGRDNRDAYTYGFENGLDGWTALDVNVDGGTWVHSNNNPGGYIDPSDEPYYPALAHTGTGFAMCYSFVDYDGAYDTDSYLISPQQYTLDNNSSISFWADNANDNYPESFSVCVSTAANPTASSFTQVWGGEAKAGSHDNATVRATNNRYENWRSHTVNLGAYAGQTVWIAFHDVNYDEYEIWIDDVTINAASGTTPPTPPTPPTPDVPEEFAEFSAGPVIENLNVLPGTYYLVASATEADFEVEINVTDLPCAAPAVAVYPLDNAEGIAPTGVVLQWALDPNCTEYRLVFSSTYWPEDNDHHPSTIITEWTNQLATSYALPPLWNNTNYFWRIEQRVNGGEENGGCTTVGNVFGFTTHLNIPQALQANPTELFEGETTTLTWTAIQDRTYRHYNIYKDGELIHSTADTPDPTSNCTWVVPASELEYNMDGYVFYVTALYDEGESAPSNSVEVKVSGYSATNGINGYVYEQDYETPIPGVTVTVTGTDEFGDPHTYEATTNADGYYEMQVYVGTYTTAIATCPGYQDATPYQNGPTFSVAHEAHHDNMNFMMDEEFNMPGMVCAETVYVPGVEGDTLVHIYWTSPFSASSSPFEVQIGEGTSTTGYFPFYTLYNYSVATALYTAEELTAAGVTNAPMTSLSWYATNSISENQTGITIWMANVDNTTAPTTSPLASGMTKVYTGSLNQPTPTGWVEFTFNEGTFAWDGTSNVMILVQRNCGDWTSSIQWRYTATSFSSMSYVYTDNAPYNVETTTYGLSTSTNRPNIIMKGGNRGTAELSRSLHHYNVYRTDCYNDGPYNSDNTEFLATVWVPDTAYFDVNWPDVEPGVYKWGVSAVYQGNRTVDYPWEERESEIMWHTDCAPCIDKDMQTDITVNVICNSADSPEGTVVSFTNLNEGEQMNHPQPSITLDATGYQAINPFRKGDYSVTVYLPGYELIVDEPVHIWGHTDLRYVLTEIIYGVKNLYVSRTGWAMWDAETWEDYPIPSGGGTTSSIIDFETGDFSQFAFTNSVTYPWTVVNEGRGYCMKSGNGGVASSTSSIEASVNYTQAGTVEFDANCQGEGTGTYWDHCDFYVDGSRVLYAGANLSGWNHYSYNVAAGQHTFRWEYTKDSSVNPTGDCFRVDNINFNMGGRSESADRHLEGFKIMCTSIDGQPIFNHNTPVYRPFCQLTTVDPWSGQPTLIEGEHYLVKVSTIYSTGESDWCEPVEWVYEPCDHWGPVDEVTVGTSTQGNHVEWVFEHGFNPYAPEGSGQGGDASSFMEDCDAGMPAGWTNIDADGDGNVWVSSMTPGIYHNSGVDLTGTGHNASTAYVISGSYANQTGAVLYPDNYLVSPEVTLGGSFSFFACAQDASYAAEHFGVAVSTNGSTSAADFTTLQEWTLTAKNVGSVMSAGRSGANRAQGNWYQYTVDLSAYEGQTGYVAIRHFNCHDQFILNVDDISMNAENGAKGGEIGSAQPYQMVGANLEFNLNSIPNYNERVYFLYNLYQDSRFDVVNAETTGRFLVSADEAYTDLDVEEAFNDFREQNAAQFAMIDKVQAAQLAGELKPALPSEFMQSLFTYDYIRSRENDMCATSDPICSDSTYVFPAPVGSQTSESGPDYDCLYTQPRPVWYHFRIADPGAIQIYMHSNPQIDIDFCCWGPFDDPVTPCPYGLTEDKVVSCSYSASWNETCDIPATAQTGEYYILVITNYNGGATNITFSQTGGSGTTDCGIVPSTDVDILGFLITQDGEYDTIVGPDVREYTDFGEFGEHEYCVRPIYPGLAQLPDSNFYFSMGCPVCMSTNGEIVETCDPGNAIYAEVNNTDDQVRIYWDEQPEPPTPAEGTTFVYDFENSSLDGLTLIDADGDGNNWMLASVAMSTGYGHNASVDMILSKSYDNNTGVLYPDNYIVFPIATIVEGSTFSFWGCGQDASYVAEHFGVAVSTDGTNFTTIQEWTMAGKGAAKGVRDGRDQGTWHQFSVDLSDYAGQEIYIALRHFNCSDMFYLDIDDVELSIAAKSTRDEIVGYNIYRSTDGINYDLIATVGADVYEYFDAPGAGTYYYQVTAVYASGCESEPAVSGINPEENFVMVGVTGVGEDNDNVNLFPNPTKGNVTIQAKDMNRITVVSVLGQVVFDTELDQDEYILNMAQFTNGMYMVRIYTDGGVTVKRVTVMH